MSNREAAFPTIADELHVLSHVMHPITNARLDMSVEGHYHYQAVYAHARS